MKNWRSRVAFIGGLFFYQPFSDFFFQNLVWQKRSKWQKVLEKNTKTFCQFELFRQIPIFSVQTCPNSFVFEPNIKTIIWGCFSAQFFPLISILKSKKIQDEKQKSCFVRVDLSFHQIGHKLPLLGMFKQDILKYSYEIVVRVIFCNFWAFQFFSSKLVYFWTQDRKNIYGCFFYSVWATDFNFGTYEYLSW